MTGSENRTIEDWDRRYLWHPFTPMRQWCRERPLVITRGQGVFLYDADGNRYIDGVGSLWCNIHGHNHPLINRAVARQLSRLSHSTFLGLTHEPAVLLAKQLVDLAPSSLQRVFYSDDGSTAVEVALKLAFGYWHYSGQRQRSLFVALRDGYHGDTLGAVSVGGIDLFHAMYRPLLFESRFVPAPHPYRFDGTSQQCRDASLAVLEEILQTEADRIAAVVLEPLVQAAGGMVVHPRGFLAGVRRLTRKYGVLMIVDEVAVGFGRTGRMFACEHEQVEPDMLCLGKAITAGYLPLAATLVSEQIFEKFLGEQREYRTFYHGHTYTANPLACAAALASLEVFRTERTLEKLAAKIDQLAGWLERIRTLPYVGDVRQCGFLAGIELVQDVGSARPFDPRLRVGAALCQRMRSRGVILRPLGDVLVVFPPLAIDDKVLETLMSVIHDTIRDELGCVLSDCDVH